MAVSAALKEKIAALAGGEAPRTGSVGFKFLQFVAENGGLDASLSCQAIAKATAWGVPKPGTPSLYTRIDKQAASCGLTAVYDPADLKERATSGAGVQVVLTRGAKAAKKTGAAAKSKSGKAAKGREQEEAMSPSRSRMRIQLKSFDSGLIDAVVRLIVQTVQRTGARVRGPVPLPVKISRTTVLISPHKDKDARDQYEIRTHRRLIDVLDPTPLTVDALSQLDLAAGIDVRIKSEVA